MAGETSTPNPRSVLSSRENRRQQTGDEMDDDFNDDDRSQQVRSALLKALGLVVAVAVVIALGTVIVVQALGLDEGDSTGPVGSDPSAPRSALPTTALPVPGEESRTPEPEDERGEDADAARGRIQLDVSPVLARANERVNLTGTYRGADNVGLEVQRFEDGSWRDFGVSATVRVGTYETWVMTGRPGEQRFRMWDPAAQRGSNVVRVTIG